MKKKAAPNHLDAVAAAAAREAKDSSTDDIMRRHAVLACEANVIEQEVIALEAQLTDARARAARVEATLRGLARVVGRR
jgi:hypothetical protein